MKITESTRAILPEPLGGHHRKLSPPAASARGDFQSLSLPSMLALTEADHPARETFLAALSESLRAGLHASEPGQIAGSILRHGFDAETTR